MNRKITYLSLGKVFVKCLSVLMLLFAGSMTAWAGDPFEVTVTPDLTFTGAPLSPVVNLIIGDETTSFNTDDPSVSFHYQMADGSWKDIPADAIVHSGKYKATVQVDGESLSQQFTVSPRYLYGVKYLDLIGNLQETVTFVNDEIPEYSWPVRVLEGNETSLGEGEDEWFVALPSLDGNAIDLTNYGTIGLKNSVNLILADGAEMRVTGNRSGQAEGFSAIDIVGIIGSDYKELKVYSQGGTDWGGTAPEGKLTVSASSTVSESTSVAFNLYGMSVYGGVITATATAADGVGVSSAFFELYSGKVEVSGSSVGINASSDINVGWENLGDYIKASSYSSDLFILNGHYVTYDGNPGNPLSGSDISCEPLAGKMLVPATAVATGTGSAQYASMCSVQGNWKLPAGVKAYVVTGYDIQAGVVTLSDEPLTGLPKGVPVILIADDGATLIPEQLWLASAIGDDATSIQNSVDGKGATPLFIAGDGVTTVAELLAKATNPDYDPDTFHPAMVNTADYMAFVLDNGAFKAVIFTDSTVPEAGTCFLLVKKVDVLKMLRNPAGGDSRQHTIPFAVGNSTGISTPVDGKAERMFSLNGRKLNGKPEAKGVYIQGNRKVVIK